MVFVSATYKIMVTSPQNTRYSGNGLAAALEHIQEFSAKLASTTDLQTLYDYSLGIIKNIFHLDFSTLLLLDEQKNRLVIRATLGFPDEMVDTFYLREGQGLPSYVLHTKRIETVYDFRKEQRFEVTKIMAEMNICSAIAVPMMIANEVFGVLIGHNKVQRRFTIDEKMIFQVIANHAAIAIDNAMHILSLYESEVKREKKIEELEVEKKKTQLKTDEFESIFSNIATGVILLKGDREIVRCNDKVVDIFGYQSEKELLGQSTRIIHTSERQYQEFSQLFYKNIHGGDIIQTEYLMKKKNGSEILCRLSGQAIDQSHPPDLEKGFVWIIEDISRQKELELELLQARKLESVGTLAGGVAHDFNNILSAVMGNIGMAQRLLPENHEIHELLSAASKASLKAIDLTTKLLLFTSSDKNFSGYTQLQAIIHNETIRESLSENINLILQIPHDLRDIAIPPDHLKAILQNLFENASSSMPNGGDVVVRAVNTDLSEDRTLGISKNSYVQLTVADNGIGMDSEVLDKIFDPYFTTKSRSADKGIGLGLAIVYAIVSKNRGFIKAYSTPDKGTVFSILLPSSHPVRPVAKIADL